MRAALEERGNPHGRINNDAHRLSEWRFLRICSEETLDCAVRFLLRTCCSQVPIENREAKRLSSARLTNCPISAIRFPKTLGSRLAQS